MSLLPPPSDVRPQSETARWKAPLGSSYAGSSRPNFKTRSSKDACQLSCQIQLEIEWVDLGPSERPNSPLEKAAGDSISQDRTLSTVKEREEKRRQEKGRKRKGGRKSGKHRDAGAWFCHSICNVMSLRCV